MTINADDVPAQIEHVKACIAYFDANCTAQLEGHVFPDRKLKTIQAAPIGDGLICAMAAVIGHRVGVVFETVGDIMDMTGLEKKRLLQLVTADDDSGGVISNQWAGAILTEHLDDLEEIQRELN